MRRISIKNAAALLMIIPTMLWLNLFCSSTPAKFSLTQNTADEWISKVEKTILEQERAEKVKKLGLQLIDLANSMTLEVEELSAEATILNENYETTKDDMHNVLSEFIGIRNATFSKYRDVIFAIRSEVNAEEWNKLTD